MRTNKKPVALPLIISLTIFVAVFFIGCTPSGPQAVLDGARLLREGRPDQAVPRLEEGVRQLPRNAQAWNYLGLAYHQSGRHTNASKAYQHALILDRNLSAARFNLGCLNLDQGNAAAAVSELTTYTVLQPGAAVGWTKLGTAQLRTRQWDAAERSFSQALKLDPALPDAWNGMGLVQVQRRRYPEALNSFNSALKLKADHAPALLNAAIVWQQNLNNRPAALQRFREYLAIKPPPPNAVAVREMVDHLESELRPPARLAVTNPAPVIANTTPRPETNPAAQKPQATGTNKPGASPPATIAAVAAGSNLTSTSNAAITLTSTPPARAAATNSAPPTSQSLAATSPPAPTEVVQVPREDPIQPVRDIPSTRVAIAETNVPQSRPLQTPPPAETAGATVNAGSGQSPANTARPKQPLIKKLNPVNWFRSKSSDTNTTAPSTPAPAPTARAPEVTRIPSVGGNTNRPTELSSPESKPPASRTPRYAYRSPDKPGPGDRSEAERWIIAGVKARDRNRLTEAVDAFQKSAAADPSLFEAHYNLGVAALEGGDYRRALAAYEQALAINPDSMKARFNFALTLQRAGFPQDAANELERIVAANPSEGPAQLELANLYAGPLREPARARAHYQSFLKLHPGSPQATAVRSWLESHP